MRMNLSGFRVLDLSRALTGPFCSMILGDLGAEIVKVEPPGGDETRFWGPPFLNGESAYFMCVNRNKRSIVIDLKNAAGKELLLELAAKADIFLENFRPGVVARLGIDYETVSSRNSKIIYASISGFGQDGPYKNRTAYDLIIQGMSGFMGITGEPGRPPVRVGVAISDLAGGLMASIGILSALVAREKTERGQFIDVSLLDSSVYLMTYMAANYFATGIPPDRTGSVHPNIAPYQVFKAADQKYVNVAVGNDATWKKFCEVLNLSSLVCDDRFRTNAGRVQNRNALVTIIKGVLENIEGEKFLSLLEAAGIPAGPIYDMAEVFRDPQIKSRKMLLELEHRKAGRLRMPGVPFKFSHSEAPSCRSPPLLGEHTRELLSEILGYSAGQIEELLMKGVVGD